jgi:hypothetical protein
LEKYGLRKLGELDVEVGATGDIDNLKNAFCLSTITVMKLNSAVLSR